MQHGDVCLVAEAEGKGRGKSVVELDSDQASAAGGQDLGQRTAARADLDDGAVGEIAEGVHDAVPRLIVDEEVLAQLRFTRWRHSFSG